MTNQLLASDSLTMPTIDLADLSAIQMASISGASTLQPRTLEAMKTQYQIDQQVKFLSLQAEAESLIQQLQALKQQRQLASVGTPNQ